MLYTIKIKFDIDINNDELFKPIWKHMIGGIKGGAGGKGGGILF